MVKTRWSDTFFRFTLQTFFLWVIRTVMSCLLTYFSNAKNAKTQTKLLAWNIEPPRMPNEGPCPSSLEMRLVISSWLFKSFKDMAVVDCGPTCPSRILPISLIKCPLPQVLVNSATEALSQSGKCGNHTVYGTIWNPIFRNATRLSCWDLIRPMFQSVFPDTPTCRDSRMCSRVCGIGPS